MEIVVDLVFNWPFSPMWILKQIYWQVLTEMIRGGCGNYFSKDLFIGRCAVLFIDIVGLALYFINFSQRNPAVTYSSLAAIC